MATKQKNKAPKRAEWQGYLHVNLTKEQETYFDEWLSSQSIQVSDFGILANNGYKFSISWDDFHEGVSATLYASSQKLAWPGFALTAWAESAEEAVGLLFYKHYIVCEEDWEHFKDEVERSHLRRG
jgi:hypothetical protein